MDQEENNFGVNILDKSNQKCATTDADYIIKASE